MADALDFVLISMFVISLVFHGANVTNVFLCTNRFIRYLPHIIQGCFSVTEAIVLGKWLWRMWVKLTSTTPLQTMIKCDISWDHYNDVTMGSIASQITSLTIVCSADYSGADQRKHQSSASLALVRGIHRGPVNSPHKRPLTRKMFPFDDVIMNYISCMNDT